MALPNLCEITGTLMDLNGLPLTNAIIRGGCFNQPFLISDQQIGVKTDYIQTLTTSTGTFSIKFPQGSTIWLSIPSIGYREQLNIPTDSISIAFTSLTPAGSGVF